MTNSIELISTESRPEVGLRLRKLIPLLKEAGVDAALIASNTNIYYLSGRFFRGYVYVTSEGNEIFFIVSPNDFAPADDIVYIRKPEQIPDELDRLGLPLPGRLALELADLSYNDCERLRAAMRPAELIDASPILREARLVKTPLELKLMKADGQHQAAAYHKVSRLYKRDMTDVEFQVEIERILRLEGNLGYSRVAGNLMEINLGSVISGENADTPSPYDFAMGGEGEDPSLPCGANGSIIHAGESVMVDMNGCFNGYQTDMTRVWTVGDVAPLARKAHECSRRILRALEKAAIPGVEVCRLYEIAEKIVEEEGLSDYFMGHRQKARFIGHGVGIELNEAPAITARNRQQLLENMTLALEPKFVIPGTGAVGVENTYIVTPGGLENITRFPEELQNLL